MRKIAVFGCKTTTKFTIECLSAQFKISHLITISPDLADKHQVADYCELTKFADSLDINVYVAQTYNLKGEADVEAIDSMKLDLAFVIGWQRLIPENILSNIWEEALFFRGTYLIDFYLQRYVNQCIKIRFTHYRSPLELLPNST